MKRLFLSVLVLLVAILLMSPSLSLGQPKYGGTLTIANPADLKIIDPHKVLTAQEGIDMLLVCNSLVEAGKNFEVLPALAESWKASPDGKEWTFFLRKGVKFHNGREFKADDVKWNMARLMDPQTAALSRTRFDMLESVEVVDDYTVKFVLNKPSGSFLSLFSGGTIVPLMIAKECVGEDGTVTQPIGTGPFEFVEWKPNDQAKYKKFNDYWEKGLPYLDEVILKPVPDDTVKLIALKTGDVDIAALLPFAEVAKLLKAPSESEHYSLAPQASTAFIDFNCAEPPFNNVKLRQAVSYAINKQELLMGVNEGIGEIINQPFPHSSFWYCDVPEIEQDLEKAKALLAEAGYPNGLEASLTVTNTYPFMVRMAEIIQAQLAQIGLKVTLDVSDWSNYISQMSKGKFQFSVCGWSAYGDPDLYFPALLLPDGAYHWFFGPAEGYNNPELSELVRQAGAETDQNKRKELYTRAAEIYYLEDAAWIHTTLIPGPTGWKDYVKGFEPSVGMLLRYADGGVHHTWLDK